MSFTSSLIHPTTILGFASGARTTSIVGGEASGRASQLRALRRAESRERRAVRRSRGIAEDVTAATRELALLRVGLPH